MEKKNKEKESPSKIGVNLKKGYKGYNDDLTSKQAGSIRGMMVKKMIEKAASQM